MTGMVELMERLADEKNDDEDDDDIAAFEAKIPQDILQLVQRHDVPLC